MIKKIITIVFCAFVCTAACIAVIKIENGKQKPYERVTTTETQTEADESEGAINTDSDSQPKKKIYYGELALEVISYDVIDDSEIEEQTEYSAENFYSGCLPDSDYMVDTIDYEAVAEVCPELKSMWDGTGDYTIDEQKQIYQDNIDIISEYTTHSHPDTVYVFVKCSIENTGDGDYESDMGFALFSSPADKSSYESFGDAHIYFDRAVNTIGDERLHRFFWYKFAPHETLECTIGFEITVTYGEDEEYYIGVLPFAGNFPEDVDSLSAIKLGGGNNEND